MTSTTPILKASHGGQLRHPRAPPILARAVGRRLPREERQALAAWEFIASSDGRLSFGGFLKGTWDAMQAKRRAMNLQKAVCSQAKLVENPPTRKDSNLKMKG